MTDGSPNKFIAKIGNLGKVDPTIQYIWDANAVVSGNPTQTGAFRPATTTDFAANISVSGLSLSVGNVGVTGGYIGITGIANVNITNPLVAISGAVQVIETGVRQVQITNASPIAVSGTFTSSVPTYIQVASTGYVSGFSPFAGPQYIRGIQGYSKNSLNQGFGGYLQIYDGNVLTNVLPVQSGLSFWLDLAENGVLFNNFKVVNSSDPVSNQQYNTSDFFVSIIYR